MRVEGLRLGDPFTLIAEIDGLDVGADEISGKVNLGNALLNDLAAVASKEGLILIRFQVDTNYPWPSCQASQCSMIRT